MKSSAEKLALVLKIVVTLVFVINLAALPALPFLLSLRYNLMAGYGAVMTLLPLSGQYLYDYAVSLVFYFFCGLSTAFMLWQARGLLGNIALRRAFVKKNSLYMRRAAICAFVISALALTRSVIWLFKQSLLTVLTAYNTLFIPLFFVAGLLFLVLSGLFREAAAIKEDNDLTI